MRSMLVHASMALLAGTISACSPPAPLSEVDASGPDASAPIDGEQFCIDRRVSECFRDRSFGRTTQDEYVACANAIASMCEGAELAPDCHATMARVDACIAALRDETRFATTSDMIPECFVATICD